MLLSFEFVAGAIGLALMATPQAQAQSSISCGGSITNGELGTFTVQYFDNEQMSVLTTVGRSSNESYLLYCGDQPSPDTMALLVMGIPSNIKTFKVPVQRIAVEDPYSPLGGSFIGSYVELAGGNYATTEVLDPSRVVSPCLQQKVQSGNITSFQGAMDQYTQLDATFRPIQHQGQIKDIWVPTWDDSKPLFGIEYIKAVSMFFGNGQSGESVYKTIKDSYMVLQDDMIRIPKENKKRIAWVMYDFNTKYWRLRNNPFSRNIIIDAGGIPFPLSGIAGDQPSLTADEIKIMIRNAQVVIDETDFSGQGNVNPYTLWKRLIGFADSERVPVIDQWKVYSLDNTFNPDGISDAHYRVEARPDLLLKDIIHSQYPTYDPAYRFTFLNEGFVHGDGPSNLQTADMCNESTVYNKGDIKSFAAKPQFNGDSTPPPPAVGGGIYGSEDGGSGGEQSGGGKKSGVVAAVVSVAVILGAGFAFAFFKWTRRAKEDRFIELEEEMNNEIPLH
ncbi:hypothetical protein BG011_006299 [Mortierella polycephala]|uniref:Uncharacterized protein n=1 Tax=Mortierella polycephala TaxID=41804 RepID=A0A9P6PWH8_9FUNG|nr:hypothetical protein BG011_006299 [Mortierella polycephala]